MPKLIFLKLMFRCCMEKLSKTEVVTVVHYHSLTFFIGLTIISEKIFLVSAANITRFSFFYSIKYIGTLLGLHISI